MKIAVCVKQTFDTEAKIVLKDGKISGDGINLIINPYDEVAVEEALQIKAKQGGEVIVICAGSDRATEAIRQALAMGADRGVLIKMADGDVDEYARAVILAEVLKEQGADLILCGHVAADDGSSQVPTRAAEIMGIPHANVVTKLEFADGKAICTREVDGGMEVMEVALPAIVTCQVSLNEPRYPSMKGIMQAKKKPVANVDAPAVESKAKVVELVLPAAKQAGRKLEGMEPEDAAKELAAWLLNEVKVEVKK
ncbi:MAG: electron transfer flavoprotein subunit beta/FixA family protein [Syntrophomonadaceae bacterium]|nr:electron transfer flavoprotein subunit beta/FixA family protein [Syntrophomonadaceae bacterium]